MFSQLNNFKDQPTQLAQDFFNRRPAMSPGLYELHLQKIEGDTVAKINISLPAAPQCFVQCGCRSHALWHITSLACRHLSIDLLPVTSSSSLSSTLPTLSYSSS